MYSYSRLLMLSVFTVLGFTWGLSSLEARPAAGGHHEEHHEMQHGERRGEHPGERPGNEHRDNRENHDNWEHRGVGGVGGVGGLGRDQGGAVIIDNNGNGNDNNDDGDYGDDPAVDQQQADQLYNSYNPANK